MDGLSHATSHKVLMSCISRNEMIADNQSSATMRKEGEKIENEVNLSQKLKENSQIELSKNYTALKNIIFNNKDKENSSVVF